MPPSPPPPVPPRQPDNAVAEQELHERLFQSFPGYTWSERGSTKTSWTWAQGYDIQRNNVRKWVCRLCIARRNPQPGSYSAHGLQNAAGHLYTEHRITAPDGEAKSRSEKTATTGQRTTLRSIAGVLNLDTSKPHEQAMVNAWIKSFNRDHFHRLLIEWIIGENLPFSTVNSQKLRNFFNYLHPSIAVTKANLSHTTLTSKIIREYERHRQTIIQKLSLAEGQIHIAYDGWTTRNQVALCGIACFFRDKDSMLHKIILGLPEVTGKHTGSNIAGEVLDILHEYQIDTKLGYSTLDNASNNDAAQDVIGAECGFNGAARRARCFGHILNLSAKALLFGNDTEAFEEQLVINEAQYVLWRKKGPVGKLHNMVLDIDRSGWLSGKLKHIQQEKFSRADTAAERQRRPVHVILDNDTRWLSQLYMIRRAVELRSVLPILLIEYRQEWERDHISKRTGQLTQGGREKMPRILKDENQLRERDWEVLLEMEALLTAYETVLRTLEGDGQVRKRKHGWEGSYGNIWDVLLGFEMLLEKLEALKIRADTLPDADFWKVGVNLAWLKLAHYYEKVDETPIYYAALALHPAYRWDWFEETWATKPAWITLGKSLVNDVWLTEYALIPVHRSATHFVRGGSNSLGENQPHGNPDNADEEPRVKRRKFHNPFARGAHTQATPEEEEDSPVDGDEYDHWMRHRETADSKIRDPIKYWHERRHRYPRLSRMALDFMTIQAMSAECERLFSAAGRMMSPLRSRLDVRMLGMAQVLRSWYRSGLIQDMDSALIPVMGETHGHAWANVSHEEAARQATAWLNDPHDHEELGENGERIIE